MKIERKALLMLLVCVLFFCAACAAITVIVQKLAPKELALQPELHLTAGTSLMFIPEGCKIGDVKAPENGVYISVSKLIEAIKQDREEELRNRI